MMDNPEEPQLIRTGKYTVSRKEINAGEWPRETDATTREVNKGRNLFVRCQHNAGTGCSGL